ncbi:MAG: DUF2141 domain-containing protein [Tannerellaceae bacterium]|nr:DUF2141 domain-containing protein [Tannerellaceae bacterium]
MKSLVIKVLVLIGVMLFSENVMAQTANLTIEVKGIKEVKGSILVAVTSSSDPQQMVYDMIPVTGKETIVHTLENVPVGLVDVSAFQDLNENYQLDMDEQQIPVEPCFRKQKVKIQEDTNKLVVKLVNVKELMGN